MKKILVIEDNPTFGYVLKEYLKLHDFEVMVEENGANLFSLIEKYNFSVCLLDIMFPDDCGFKIAQRIKLKQPDLPFIFISARAMKIDRLKGFKIGCDDYIVKPIDEELLLARIHAVIKRNTKYHTDIESSVCNIGSFIFNPSLRTLMNSQVKYNLSPKESDLLCLLINHKNKLLLRQFVLNEIWTENTIFTRKSMDVFVYNLRKKLALDTNLSINNIHGRGFILEERSESK